MSTDLALPIASDVTVYATNPREMAQAQAGMVGWCDTKIAGAEKQRDEFFDNEERAAEAAWPGEAKKWRKQALKAQRRVEFYQKLQTALKAGYLIVPPMPFQAFAIRTKRTAPSDEWLDGNWHDHEQKAQALPAGQGEYQNPFPAIQHETERETGPDKKEIVKQFTFATGFRPLAFPFSLAHPEILNATNKAMMLKIFDSIGVLPRHRAPDPIVVGTIRSPQKNDVHFFIAWWLDPDTLK